MRLSSAEQALASRNDALSQLIRQQGHIERSHDRDYFGALASSIISQQISVKAAASIFGRFEQRTKLTPERVLALTTDDQKAIGLSGQKLTYLQSLAQHFVDNPAVFNHLDSLDDDAVITELTRVKGIGVWTAQMFLIFTLHRPDVFAPDDRGLQLAIQKLYSLPTVPPRNELIDIAAAWRPYCTAACLHLWESLGNKE